MMQKKKNYLIDVVSLPFLLFVDIYICPIPNQEKKSTPSWQS